TPRNAFGASNSWPAATTGTARIAASSPPSTISFMNRLQAMRSRAIFSYEVGWFLLPSGPRPHYGWQEHLATLELKDSYTTVVEWASDSSWPLMKVPGKDISTVFHTFSKTSVQRVLGKGICRNICN